MLHNTGNALKSFLKNLGLDIRAKFDSMFKGIVGGIGEFLKSSGNPMLAGIASGLEKITSGTLGNLITAPVRGIGGLLQAGSNKLKKLNLRTGASVYDKTVGRNLSAEERLKLRNRLGASGKGQEKWTGII